MGQPQFELNYPPNVLCDHNLHKLKRSALYAVCAIVLTLCQSDDWPVAASKQQMTLQPWGSTVGPLVLDLFLNIALTDLSGLYCCCCNNTFKCGGEWPRIRRNSKIVSRNRLDQIERVQYISTDLGMFIKILCDHKQYGYPESAKH